MYFLSRYSLLLALFACMIYIQGISAAPVFPKNTAASFPASTTSISSVTATKNWLMAPTTEPPTRTFEKRTCNKKRDGTDSDLAGYWWDCTTTTTTTTTPCDEPTGTSSPDGDDGDDGYYDGREKARDPYGPGIQPQMAIVGSIAMAMGLFFMAMGFNMFRLTLFFTGFLGGNMLTWVLLNYAEPLAGYPREAVTYICACFGVGIIFGMICIICYNKAILFVGALGMYIVSLYIWSWRNDFVIINPYARNFTSLGFAVVGMLSAFVLERGTVIIATSFMGAYCFILGLDLFVHTYMVNGPRGLLNANPRIYVDYQVDNKVYAMLGAILALFLVSFIWQKIFTRGNRFGLDLIKK